MASPIQVVLEPRNFILSYERPPGGSKKDLYAGRNRAFRKHRDALVAQVESLQRTNAFTRSRVNVASVELAPDALAKSNRPAGLLRDLASVGSVHGGELLVRVTADDLAALRDRIAKAPSQVQTVEKIDRRTGEVTEEPRPSALRCDVGAIERIGLWTAKRRLSLTVDQVQRWLEQAGTPLGLIVQLFEFESIFSRDSKLELARLQKQLRKFRASSRLERLGDVGHTALYLQVNLKGENAAVWRGSLARALELLRDSFLVRSIAVPARLESSAARQVHRLNRRVNVPMPRSDVTYPIVGVVDGGVAEPLSNWVAHTEAVIDTEHGDNSHGTYIGGLLVLGQALNGPDVVNETDGCRLIDICMVPSDDRRNLFKRYFGGENSKFMDELDYIVGKLRKQHDVRVFNFSLNLTTPGRSPEYSYETRRLDEIAHKHDVVFVISAGNLPDGSRRAEWPEGDVAALQALAMARDDQIESPAESMTNIAVAAVNPPGVAGYLERMPSAYSRRGPSAFGGVKPDVAQYGGCAVSQGTRSGLLSLSPSGVLISEFGTSYAAPLVAKTLACYTSEIEGKISREMLIALLVHHAEVPDLLRTPAFESLARDLVGFGVPRDARSSLDGNPHAVTITFEEKIPKGKRLEFDFAWPKSLTDGGRCRGRGRLTLVARPLLDSAQGHEVVRTQLDSHVMQLGINGKKKGGHFRAGHLPKVLRGRTNLREAERIRHALKWSPIKTYHFKAPKGRGETSNWKLTVEALERTPGEIPKEGIHFVAILTIEDIDSEAPVFEEMRAALSRHVAIADIRTGLRTRIRSGR